MSPLHLRNLRIPRSQPENRPGIFRTRKSAYGHHSGCQGVEGNHTHSAINLPIQQETQTRGLEGYRSSPSAPSTPERFIPMENGPEEVQPSFTLGRTQSRFPKDISQRDTLQRPYGNHQRLEYQQEAQTPGGKGSQDKG
ncbi:hypothetical protein O181_004964 [Austropuccinia psidii MF-1]|uniref:Uncharacterized protein n=1 Tax=Austropuccinia psidii MF-1 TaxID=1389203 RepID=A0A9Q3GFE8_9BASI|nr:hypothetical protein [Austropuccinia psidii MF-1]